MVFRPLYQFLGEEFDFIDMVKTDLPELFGSNLMIEVDHPVPVTCHFSHFNQPKSFAASSVHKEEDHRPVA